MNLNTSSYGSSFYGNRRWSEGEADALRRAPARTRPQARGRDYSAAQRSESLRETQTRRVLPPRNIKMEETRPDLLSRALSWLRGNPPAPKRLRLAETVSLGEKRFVAIIHAEGHKFLVGGGASGVVLLTDLDEEARPLENVQAFTDLIEAAG